MSAKFDELDTCLKPIYRSFVSYERESSSHDMSTTCYPSDDRNAELVRKKEESYSHILHPSNLNKVTGSQSLPRLLRHGPCVPYPSEKGEPLQNLLTMNSPIQVTKSLETNESVEEKVNRSSRMMVKIRSRRPSLFSRSPSPHRNRANKKLVMKDDEKVRALLKMGTSSSSLDVNALETLSDELKSMKKSPRPRRKSFTRKGKVRTTRRRWHPDCSIPSLLIPTIFLCCSDIYLFLVLVETDCCGIDS